MSLVHPIGYLERTDFNKSGDFMGNKPVFIMLQNEKCGYCQIAKPAFQALANEGIISCMTIQTDGVRKSERDIKMILDKIYPDMEGFPSYLLYTQNKRIPYRDGRSTSELREFILQHS